MNKIIVKYINKNIHFLVLLCFLFVAIIIKLFVLGNQLLKGIPLTNTLDFSWQTDIVERFLQGFIAGKDFIITYGPIYQLLTSLPSQIFRIPSYNGILYAQIILYCLAICLVFFIAKLLVSKKKEIIILFIYLLFILDLFLFPDANNLIRILFPLFYALLYSKFILTKQRSFISWLVIFSFPAIAGLYVYDLFALLLLATIIFVVIDIALLKSNKKVVLFGLLQISIIIVFELLVSLLLSNNLNYLFYSLTTIKDYQYIENIPFSLQHSDVFFMFPLMLIFLFLYILRKTFLSRSEKVTLSLLFVTALFELKSTFIRSDETHITMGIYPSIVVLFIVLFFIIQKKRFNFFFGIFFIFLYTFIPYKDAIYPIISLSGIKTAVDNISHPRTFFEIYRLPNNYYYSKNDFLLFSKLISKNPGSVFIYPYDTYILNVFGQTYNTLPLQFYDYSNSLVEKNAVARLVDNPPKYIILGVDTKGALMLDNIPNFTRNPLLAKWMISNYSVTRVEKKYLILIFNPNKKVLKKASNCEVYDIDTSTIIQGIFYESLFKPSTYYLNTIQIRLPYKPQTNIFFSNSFTNTKKLSDVFNSYKNFAVSHTVSTNTLVVIKKYPFPKFRHLYTDLSITCYQ